MSRIKFDMIVIGHMPMRWPIGRSCEAIEYDSNSRCFHVLTKSDDGQRWEFAIPENEVNQAVKRFEQ